jgi:mono/diheme cytochrome c family protein
VRRATCILFLAVLLAPPGAHGGDGGADSAADATATVDTEAAALYDRLCLPCHGAAGDGRGPAAPWLWPRPRDFRRGTSKWRTTASGTPATDADLARAIRHGMPGTSMPGFAKVLSDDDIAALVARVRGFASAPRAASGPALVLPSPPPLTPTTLDRGRVVWSELGCDGCHGPGGRGDGRAAAGLTDTAGLPAPPYDLTVRPLRRPGAAPDRASIFASLVTGLDGTPMPSYRDTAADDDLWAVAAWVDHIRYRPDPKAAPQLDPTHVDPIARQLARAQPIAVGRWPGAPELADARVFGSALALQGAVPPVLAPAQAELAAGKCGRCHAKQLREWRTSRHALAAGPGLIGQVLRLTDGRAESCLRCHAPLAEQLTRIRPVHSGGDPRGSAFRDNPAYDETLRDEGITCAACHVRAWQRLGPPPAATTASLLPLPAYPKAALPIYERSDLCLGCHQLPPQNTLAGKPLLNTYREWLEGPYMRRGIQCQHCHMPSREHAWLGIHDPETFRQGVRLEASARRSPTTGAVTVRARLHNVGAGHYLPTTPTPAVWLRVELHDTRGRPIADARAEIRIGRHLRFDGERFHELEDTRIPPGESLALARVWRGGRTDQAALAVLRVEVAPDDYYEHLFARRLRDKLTAEIRAQFATALAAARSTRYVALERRVPL